MMKILLAVDGSPYTKKMLAYLAAHDELLGNGARHAYTVITVQAALPPRARAALSKEMIVHTGGCLFAREIHKAVFDHLA